jgi:signal transduction histidine kinase
VQAASLFFVFGEFVLVGLTGGFEGPLAPLLFAAAASVVIAHGRGRQTRVAVAFVGAACVFFAAAPATWFAIPLTSLENAVVAAAATLHVVALVTMTTVALTDAQREALALLDASREESIAAAEDRARAIESVGARVGHELKNPLAAIKGLVQLLARTIEEDKSKNRIDVVLREIGRMESIVAEYLSFSRPLSDMRVERVELADVADDVVAVLEARALAADVRLRREGKAGALEGDPRRLKEALLNLVANAVEATRVGGAVTVTLADDANGACVTVEDTGRGLAAADLERLGTPYFTTRKGGTGLGVVLARAVIGQHGGTLVYASELGRGTTATVRIPRAATKAKGTNAEDPAGG